MYLQYRNYTGALYEGFIVTQTTWETVVWTCGRDKSHRLVLVRWTTTDDGSFWQEVAQGNFHCVNTVRKYLGKKRHSRVVRFLLAQGITLNRESPYVETAADKRRRLIENKTYSLNQERYI